jgi:hypothetical protein
VGFRIPNEFVVGYGLDYAQKLRNLPYISIVDEDDLRALDAAAAGSEDLPNG